MDLPLEFQPRQVVFLEHAGTRLYAEVIQVVTGRKLCWVRPLLLAVMPSSSVLDNSLPVTDLRSSADLLWPATLFRPALDTEIIPLLVTLLPLETEPERDPVSQQQLSQFIHQVWQAKKSEF